MNESYVVYHSKKWILLPIIIFLLVVALIIAGYLDFQSYDNISEMLQSRNIVMMSIVYSIGLTIFDIFTFLALFKVKIIVNGEDIEYKGIIHKYKFKFYEISKVSYSQKGGFTIQRGKSEYFNFWIYMTNSDKLLKTLEDMSYIYKDEKGQYKSLYYNK
jgi:hypothetical protein